MILDALNALYFPFGDVEGEVPLEPLADFRTALRYRLKSRVPGLDEVYWNAAGSGKSYPILVINAVTKSPEVTNQPGYVDLVELQFTVLASDSVEAEDLGEAAYAALIWKAANPPLLFSEGYEMARYQGAQRGPYEQAGQGPGGRDVWMYSFDFSHMIGRN